MIQTEFLILRKTPYQESSLVVAGLSPDQGQIHFLVRGARRLGARSFPMVDLFRVLSVEFNQRGTGLQSWRSPELRSDYGRLVRDPQCTQAAGRLARFCLANVAEGLPHPQFFQAAIVAFQRLARAAEGRRDAAQAIHAAHLVPLVLLDESGELPHWDDEATARRRALLLEMLSGRRDIPALRTGEWEALEEWLRALALERQYRI